MANFQLGDTQKASYAVKALDADGNPAQLQPGDAVTVTSSDTASVSISPDAVPSTGSIASGFIVGGAKLQTGVAITGSFKPAGGTTTLNIQALVDVVGGAATSIAFTFGTPVPQGGTTPPPPAPAA